MDSSRRSFDRSRETGLKRARMTDDPNLRDPRLLSSGGVRGGVRAPPADVRYMQIEREDEANDSNGGGYHPTHQLFSELVSEYRKGLAELTINSKPIITNLTIIAGENLHAAKSIAEAICSHIIEVPSEQKLPSLYLLDSIVKNIGRDYIKYFSTKLPEVFCKAYKQADPSIHSGLRHLFRTWEGVFPLQPLQMIEKDLGISLAINGSGSVSARSKPEPPSQYPQKSIHVNPKYLEARQKLQPPSRVKGPTTGISSNGMKSTGNAARLSIQHREPARESMYEKDAEVAFDDYDFSLKKSSIGEHDKHWYGTGTNMADTVVGQRNGYDGKRKLASCTTPQSHASRTNGGMPSSWKNNEEEEYLWDDINSGVIKHSTPADPRKDNLGFDESDDMERNGVTLQSIQSADYARVLGMASAGASSSLGRKALQPQMIRNPVTGALARSQTNNSPAIVQKRPPPPSRQPTLHQRSPSPSFSSGHGNSALGRLTEIDLPVSHSVQRTVSKSSEIPERDNIRPRGQLKRDSPPMFSETGKKQHLDSQKSKGIASSDLSSQQRMPQHPLPDHSRPEEKLSEPISEALTSGTSVAEAVHYLTSSELFSSMLNSRVLSKEVSIPKSEVDVEDMPEPLHSDVHPPVRGGLAHRQMPYKPPEMSAAPITTSSQANKPVSASRRIGAPSQTTSSKNLSKNEGEEKTAAANPYSNLLSTLMEKGLITSSKNDSSTTALPPNGSEGVIPGVISKSLMSTIVPDSSPNSSLFVGDKLSALEHAAHKAVDTSKAPEVKNLIGFEFKPSLIRQLHEPVIEDLIDGLPYRCNICGLRLKIQERLDKHMEWHSSKELDNEYGASRKWFLDLDDWVAGNSYTAVNPEDSAEEIEDATVEDEPCLVPADENQCVCILCGELFEDYYSHEEDGWMFRGAMHAKFSGPIYESTTANNVPTRDFIVHAECFTESSARELGLVAKIKMEEDA